jgi:hypothetical protein
VTPYDVAATAIRGGWNNSTINELAPSTRAMVLRADAEYELEGRQQQAERAARGEDLRMRSIMLAVEAAQARGEAVSLVEELRSGGRGVGMTRRERELVSAMMDVEDQRREAAARRAFAKFREGADVEVGFGAVVADNVYAETYPQPRRPSDPF